MLDDLLIYFFELEKVRLCLFGFFKNGFGFWDSDLDICMILEGYENVEVSSIWKGFKSLFCFIVNLF